MGLGMVVGGGEWRRVPLGGGCGCKGWAEGVMVDGEGDGGYRG